MNEPGTGRPVVKHTPEPWAVDPDDRPGMEWNIHIVEAGDPNRRICFMTSDGNEANARLIAAAPELLEALKALQLQALQSDVNSPANDWGREALEMSRAAIAKATGTAGERP